MQAPAEKLRNRLNTDSTALSKQARQEREQALEDVNNLSQAVLDLSFNAVALDQEAPIYDARCPFLGLYPFRVENRKFFFGRERLITQLQQKLAKDNFLAVFGANELTKTPLSHQSSVTNVVFSRDGYTLASGSADNKVILWDINHLNMDALLDSLMVSACNSAKDYLHNSQQVEESDRHLCDGIAKETQ